MSGEGFSSGLGAGGGGAGGASRDCIGGAGIGAGSGSAGESNGLGSSRSGGGGSESGRRVASRGIGAGIGGGGAGGALESGCDGNAWVGRSAVRGAGGRRPGSMGCVGGVGGLASGGGGGGGGCSSETSMASSTSARWGWLIDIHHSASTTSPCSSTASASAAGDRRSDREEKVLTPGTMTGKARGELSAAPSWRPCGIAFHPSRRSRGGNRPASMAVEQVKGAVGQLLSKFVARAGVCIAATGFALLALGGGTAAADVCLQQVQQLAARYGVSIDPPTLSQDNPSPPATSGTTTKDLGRSGGVIEPPEIRDKAVISPPRGLSYGMPTLPDVKPSPDKPGEGAGTELSRAVII